MRTTQKTMVIGNQQITYNVRISERARRYRIAVSPQGVELVLPRGVPLFRADSLMRSHANWLEKQLVRIKNYQKRAEKQKAKEIQLPGGTILFRGSPCRLVIKQSNGLGNRMRIEQLDGHILMTTPAGKAVNLEASLQRYLRQFATRLIPRRVHAVANAMNLQPRRISIRNQRTRWGSCSSRGTVCFNWRLVMATPEVLDYVIIHELAHLAAPNHSPRFWELVQTYCPDFKKHRSWLKNQQALLYRPLINGKN